jgi:uncharacterized protein (TIGR01777 family)
MTKTVVVGGTGFVGRALVAARVSRGDEVVVLGRAESFAGGPIEAPARFVRFSLDDRAVRERWTREVASADVVVNLAGAGIMDRPWTPARRRELALSRVDVTRAVAEAVASGGGGKAPVLVSASAVGIYGMRRDDELCSEGSPSGHDFLARLCVDWEEATMPASVAGALVVLARFGIVLGNGGGALPEILRPFRMHVGGPIGDGTQWVSWIHVTDLVGALELLMTSAAVSGPVNLVAPAPVTAGEEAKTIARVLGTHAIAAVPAFVLRTILGRERAEVLLTGQRASAGRLLSLGYAFRFPELEPALRDLLGKA